LGVASGILVEIIAGGGMTLNVTEFGLFGLATGVAVTVTLKLDETDAGALYTTEVAVTLVKVPHEEPEHPGPVALHVTPLLPVSSIRLAVKCRVCPWSMLGGMAGLIVAETSKMLFDEPPQPHIHVRNEIANASFLIYAFPLP
jgi:hypothetical protein